MATFFFYRIVDAIRTLVQGTPEEEVFKTECESRGWAPTQEFLGILTVRATVEFGIPKRLMHFRGGAAVQFIFILGNC